MHVRLEGGPDVDRAELGRLTDDLQVRLEELRDVADVERVLRPSPPDAKAVQDIVNGELLVAAAAVHQVFLTIRTYVERRPVRVWVREGDFEAEITGPPAHVRALADRLHEQRGRRDQHDDG